MDSLNSVAGRRSEFLLSGMRGSSHGECTSVPERCRRARIWDVAGQFEVQSSAMKTTFVVLMLLCLPWAFHRQPPNSETQTTTTQPAPTPQPIASLSSLELKKKVGSANAMASTKKTLDSTFDGPCGSSCSVPIGGCPSCSITCPVGHAAVCTRGQANGPPLICMQPPTCVCN
jgi:hypothetical protein